MTYMTTTNSTATAHNISRFMKGWYSGTIQATSGETMRVLISGQRGHWEMSCYIEPGAMFIIPAPFPTVDAAIAHIAGEFWACYGECERAR